MTITGLDASLRRFEPLMLSNSPTRAKLPFITALLAVVVLGTWLRFHELGHDGLWADELFTSSMVRQHPLTFSLAGFRRHNVFGIAPNETFLVAKASEQSPPLFELLTKISVNLLGASEFSLRLVSALAGSLWLAYLALRAYRTREPLLRRAFTIALVLGVCSAPLLAYAQECRAYALGALLTGILATELLERLFVGIEKAEAPRAWELVVFVLACHTHYAALVFAFVFLGFYGVVARRTGRRREFAKLLFVPLACVPWIALNAHTIRFTSRGGVAWQAITFGDGLRAAFGGTLETLGTSLLVLALVGVWIALGRNVLANPSSEDDVASRALRALALIATVDLVLVGFIAMRAGMMHYRFYLFALPLLHLAIALVLAASVMRTKVLALLLLPFVVGSTIELRAHYAEDKEGYREVTRWLRSHASPRATVVYTWGPSLAVYRYYLEEFFAPDSDDRAVPISTPEDAAETCARIGDAREVVLIASSGHRQTAEAALASCGERYRVARELEFRGVIGQVWARR